MTAKRKRPKVPVAVIRWDPSKVDAGTENGDGAHATKGHRPKVRYVGRGHEVIRLTNDPHDTWIFAESYSPTNIKRIAAALNLYEAVKRGEL